MEVLISHLIRVNRNVRIAFQDQSKDPSNRAFHPHRAHTVANQILQKTINAGEADPSLAVSPPQLEFSAISIQPSWLTQMDITSVQLCNPSLKPLMLDTRSHSKLE